VKAPRCVVVVASALAVGRTVSTIVGSSTVGLLHKMLSDDAFYYFDLARHFPRPEATPGILTTGFHPLYWVLLAAPVHLLGATAAVRAALLLLVAVHVAIGIAIFVVVKRGGLGDWAAALAGAGWIASPALRQISLSGVEVPLVVLLVIAASAVLVGAEPTPRRWAVAGVLAGLAVLARVDAVVVVGVVALERCVTWRRPRALVAFGLTAFAVTSVWAVWLATHGGLPDSARALRILRAHGVQVGKTGIGAVASQLARFIASSAVPAGDPQGGWRAAAGVLILLLVVVGLRSARTREWYGRWRGLLIGTALLYALYATVLGGIREWYQLYAAAAVWLVVIPPGISAVRSAGVAVAAFGTALVIALALSTGHPLFPNEADKYMATRVTAAHLPAHATAGAFNSGIYTYFTPNRIVNLDGVVNPTVQQSIDHRTLCSYLRRHSIDWLLDSRSSLRLLRAFAPGIRVTETFDLSAEYRGRDPYPVLDPQVLAHLDTSRC